MSHEKHSQSVHPRKPLIPRVIHSQSVHPNKQWMPHGKHSHSVHPRDGCHMKKKTVSQYIRVNHACHMKTQSVSRSERNMDATWKTQPVSTSEYTTDTTWETKGERVKNLIFMISFWLRCYDDWFDFLEPFKKYLASVSHAKIPAFCSRGVNPKWPPAPPCEGIKFCFV